MELQQAIENRRAFRSLSPVNITDEMIERMAKNAQITPSCNNNQPWRFIFVRDRQILEQLFDTLSKGNEWTREASMIIAVFSDLESDCVIKERDYYLFDTGMAVTMILLTATDLDLVAHPIAGYREPDAKSILGIPDSVRLITLIIVGRHSPEINPVLSDNMKLAEQNRPPRKNPEEIYGLDKYQF